MGVSNLVELNIEEKRAGEVIPFPNKNKNGEDKSSNNHKRGGKSYPFKTEQEIHDVIAYYDKKFNEAETQKDMRLAARNVMLITIGINIGVRGSDLLKLQWNQIFRNDGEFIEDDDEEEIKEKKTGKIKGLILNESCHNAILEYIKRTSIKINPNGYLFENGRGSYINVQSCSNILKEAAKACGIRRRIASHTLRKTFSLFQIQAHNDDAMFINELQALLNQDSPETTLAYAGLSKDRLKQYHHDVNLGRTCIIIANHKNRNNLTNTLNENAEEVIISKSELKYVIQKALENNENDYLLEDIINNLGLKELIK